MPEKTEGGSEGPGLPSGGGLQSRKNGSCPGGNRRAVADRGGKGFPLFGF